MAKLIDIFVSTTGFTEINRAVDFCNENKTNIEISRYARPDLLDNVCDEELLGISSLIKPTGIRRISVHGACYDLFPASLDSKIVEVTKHRLETSINIARKLEASIIIFHGGYNGQVRLPMYDRNYIQKQINFWKSFLEEHNISDLTIALENTYEDDPVILQEIFQGVNSEHFRSCIDVGHINCYSKHQYIYWINLLKDYLYHFHIHNNYGENDLHRALEDGLIDYKEFFGVIKDFEIPLSFTLEMFEEEYIIRSLKYLREICSIEWD